MTVRARWILPLAVLAAALAWLAGQHDRRPVSEGPLSPPARTLDGTPPALVSSSRPAERSLAAAEAPAEDAAPRERRGVASAESGGLHDDPLPVGGAELRLFLVDAQTLEPMKGRVQLWQLDAPETTHWNAGDLCRGQFSVPLEGALLEGLPLAEYRLVTLDGRRVGEDPPSFSVTGSTELRVPVEQVRSGTVSLTCVDEHGRVLTELTAGSGRVSYSGSFEAPDWVRERKSKDPQGWSVGGGYGGGLSERPRVVGDTRERVEVPIRERRRSEESRVLRFRIEARSGAWAEVEVASPEAIPEDPRFVVPLFTPEFHAELAARAPEDARLVWHVRAVEESSSAAWRQAPIDLWVHVDGQRGLHVEFSLAREIPALGR